jgi:hypothetical protein
MAYLALNNNKSLTHRVILLWFDKNELTTNRIEYLFSIKKTNLVITLNVKYVSLGKYVNEFQSAT